MVAALGAIRTAKARVRLPDQPFRQRHARHPVRRQGLDETRRGRL